ncbi:hypothetical protein CDAR_492011 [Caerostris darwini]|uniref:Uncharacterized protein n=1 Tax=Caerostris darwini TaxID=1538125 RepID=A0AAV4VLJ9_9ARAC|nr:hypothetical protein CDAR_492011 [Caerostris darwini]
MHLVNPNVHLPIEGRWWLVFAHRARFMERDHTTPDAGDEGGTKKSSAPLSYQDTKEGSKQARADREVTTCTRRISFVAPPVLLSGGRE